MEKRRGMSQLWLARQQAVASTCRQRACSRPDRPVQAFPGRLRLLSHSQASPVYIHSSAGGQGGHMY